jgi:hypothetical protein
MRINYQSCGNMDVIFVLDEAVRVALNIDRVYSKNGHPC